MSDRRGDNPETAITKQIRWVLSLMRIPYFKHWSGAFSEDGVPDIIGTIPGEGSGDPEGMDYAEAEVLACQVEGGWSSTGKRRPEDVAVALAKEVVRLRARGRAFWCEIKVPGKDLSNDQAAFLEKMKAAGAVAFKATDPHDVIDALTQAGFKAAERIKIQFRGRPEA